MLELDLLAHPRDPNLAHLINWFFFFPPQTCPLGPLWAPSCHAWPKIWNTNYKHTNFKFMIFQPKITNTNKNTNPNTNTNINTVITNTNFRFMIFPFKITNTNTNIEIINTNTKLKWLRRIEPRKKEKKKKKEKKNGERGGARPWEGSWVRPWGEQLSEAVRGWLIGRVLVRDGRGIWPYGLCEMGEGDERVVWDWRGRNGDERDRELFLTDCGRVNERVESWKGRGGRVSERAERWRESLEDIYT